ncbi:hypothetical protein B0H13DRAFT_2385568 [Mycena leptocephala]|nr:hypothetical protein B0H13DRAFT_2385568 [Mycena leptocephala]
MLTHTPYISEVFLGTSADGRQAIRSVAPVLPTPDVPQDHSEYFQEDVSTNAALESLDFNYTMGDFSLQPQLQEATSNQIIYTARKRYENSDFLFKIFVRYRDDYLDEMLRLEGRRDPDMYMACHGCGTPDPIYRCAHQTCYGSGLVCSTCIVKQHTLLPTHWIERWNGTFFECKGLASLDLVIQLGHPPGFACLTATAGNKNFVLIDVTGVHGIKVRFCECNMEIPHWRQLMRARWWPATVINPQTCATFAVVRLFQIMNCLGKVSAHDFMRSLELLSNNDGLHPVPIMRCAFRHIVRQYRTTLMMKRTGRGHDLSGVNGTKQGELALQCRACPQDAMNVPPGWDKIDWAAMPEDLRYKYFLFLAQDCNFRLINRDVSSAAKDPIVGNGLGYFVNNEQYAAYLHDHVTEEEISSCSGFQAMCLANKKRVKGLRTTGVGGVTCARHNMWRPNGIGDLQLGERQCNMDFILASALLNCLIFYLILSYNIACQYSKKFWERMAGLPESLVFVLDKLRVWFKVPNFHLPPHKPPCHAPFSFHWMWGAGRTHGETVEQNWEFTNGATASTKMMGMGARHATLEDLFGFHNWRRLVSWRGIFTKRLAEDVTEGQAHRDAFEAFDTALRESANEMVQGWQDWVHDWESRQHTTGAVSPFEVKEKVMSMREIRMKLVKEELLRSGEGTEIEESQRYLAIDVKSIANPTDTQTIDFLKRRAALVKRIRAFRKMQRTYMPNLRRFLTMVQRALWDTEADCEAESIRLFLPSDIADRTKRNWTGQRALTRGPGILNTLLRLLDHGPWERKLQVPKDEDVRALNERALTEEERSQRKAVHDLADVIEEEGRVASFRVVALGESRRMLSWIWYATKTGDNPMEAELVEALRVEWCKVYARTRRWPEDTVLVEEEMGHTIEYGHSAAAQWESRASMRVGVVDAALAEGLLAYAAEQAARERETCAELERKWAPLRARGRAFVAGTSAPADQLGEVDTITVERDDDDGDDKELPPDYADEDDEEIE